VTVVEAAFLLMTRLLNAVVEEPWIKAALAPLNVTVPVEAAKVPPFDQSPPMLRFPVPVNVSLAWAAVPESVTAPVQLIVPVETDTVQNLPAVALPGIVMLPALNVPVPTAIVLVIVPVVGEFMVTAPVTVSVFVPLMVMPLFAAGAFIVILATAAVLTFTVTTTPELMITISPATGTAEPPHVAVLFQFPVTEAVLVAA
jgi:hypothetical protein